MEVKWICIMFMVVFVAIAVQGFQPEPEKLEPIDKCEKVCQVGLTPNYECVDECLKRREVTDGH